MALQGGTPGMYVTTHRAVATHSRGSTLSLRACMLRLQGRRHHSRGTSGGLATCSPGTGLGKDSGMGAARETPLRPAVHGHPYLVRARGPMGRGVSRCFAGRPRSVAVPPH